MPIPHHLWHRAYLRFYRFYRIPRHAIQTVDTVVFVSDAFSRRPVPGAGRQVGPSGSTEDGGGRREEEVLRRAATAHSSAVHPAGRAGDHCIQVSLTEARGRTRISRVRPLAVLWAARHACQQKKVALRPLVKRNAVLQRPGGITTSQVPDQAVAHRVRLAHAGTSVRSWSASSASAARNVLDKSASPAIIARAHGGISSTSAVSPMPVSGWAR